MVQHEGDEGQSVADRPKVQHLVPQPGSPRLSSRCSFTSGAARCWCTPGSAESLRASALEAARSWSSSW